MKVLGMFKAWRTQIAIITLICSTSLAVEFAGGIGEPNYPYQIATAEQLIGLGEDPNLYDKHFILTADIDLDPNLPGRKVFDRAVIAAPDVNDAEKWFQASPFTGTFDGDNHTISHLTITGESYLGLFGQTGSEARISNLGLEAVDVSGTGGNVGGLVGCNLGSITSSYSTGSVSGDGCVGGLVGGNGSCMVRGSRTSWFIVDAAGSITNSYSTGTVSGDHDVGGLVGWNAWSIEGMVSITNSYSTGTVSGVERVGGLVGCNDGSITTSYSTGTVTGEGDLGGLVGRNGEGWGAYGIIVANCYSTGSVNGTGDHVGGLVGKNVGSITTSFWDIETSGQATSAGGVGLTTAEMMDPYMLGLNGFANDPNWVLDAGRDYPRLAWEGTAGQIIPEPIIDWLDGQGTEQEPYRIDSAEQLILLGKASILWDKHFVLGANIDLDPSLPNRRVLGQALIQIFTGVFDGNGHTISHLTIEGGDYLGLFGQLESTAEVRNLGVVDANVTGSGNYVGGLVGSNNEGSITSSYSTGSVSGSSYVGGLVGRNFGSITSCDSTGSVSGTGAGLTTSKDDVGGLVGGNSGSITSSYSTGTVSGDDRVGGLVGRNSGSITSSYSTGTVSGYYLNDGGLVGVNSGSITSSFWDMETSGLSESDGGTGLSTAEMQDINTYLNAGWDFVDEVVNGTEDIWKMPPYQGYPLLAWQEVPAIAELIAHWRFDETSGDIAYDSAGNNDAALHQTEFTEGKIGGAILLNGLNSYVDCGDSVVLGPEQMTLTMWLEPRHMGGVRYAVSRAKKENLDDIDYTITRHLAGEIELTLAQLDSVPVSTLSTATTPLGEWSHLAVCLDGSEASIYINGQLDSSTNYSQRVPRQGYRLVISSHQSSTRFYNGKIDDVRIYNGALSEQDILSLANPDM